MGRHLWIAGLVLCTGLVDRRTASGQPLIRVQLMDQAGIPPAIRQRAQEVATRTFQLSGIALVWLETGTCLPRCLTVRIVTEPVGTKSRDPHVLAVAPSTLEGRGINLWIFYPRIKVYSGDLGIDLSLLLGHVMAHELGHLLLPSGIHSVTGLMRAGWDRAQVQAAVEGQLTFMPEEAALMRERLQASQPQLEIRLHLDAKSEVRGHTP